MALAPPVEDSQTTDEIQAALAEHNDMVSHELGLRRGPGLREMWRESRIGHAIGGIGAFISLVWSLRGGQGDPDNGAG